MFFYSTDKPPTFYPPIGTTEGDAVKYWETTLDGVNVFILTYGSFAHPELSDKDLSEREAGKRIAGKRLNEIKN